MRQDTCHPQRSLSCSDCLSPTTGSDLPDFCSVCDVLHVACVMRASICTHYLLTKVARRLSHAQPSSTFASLILTPRSSGPTIAAMHCSIGLSHEVPPLNRPTHTFTKLPQPSPPLRHPLLHILLRLWLGTLLGQNAPLALPVPVLADLLPRAVHRRSDLMHPLRKQQELRI